MDKVSYNPLLNIPYEEDESFETGLPSTRQKTRSSRLARCISIANIAIPWLISAVLACVIVYGRVNGSDRFRQHKLYSSQQTYSPAQEEIEYKLHMFHTNIVDAPSEFQGPPSEKLDKAWDGLYNFGVSTIPEDQAKLLPNYTSPVPNHGDEYIVELDVFHQLHCLNIFRKAFTPIYLTDWDAIRDQDISSNNWTVPSSYPYEQIEENRAKNFITPWHIGHCLESLRQSVMCHSDITPAVWHWDESIPNAVKNKPWLNVPHTCRDFDRLREWGLKRELKWEFDYQAKIPVQFDVPTYL